MMNKQQLVFATVAIVVFAGMCASAQESEIAKWDPRMAVESAVVDTNGVKWIDGRFLPIEGRAFDDVEHWYDRLPANVTTNVNEGVRSMKHHTAGMQFRFKTDSRKLSFKWVPYNASLAMDHMPSTGVSGIDVYRFDESKDKWVYVKTGRIMRASGAELRIPWRPGDACLVHLPLYNGVKSFELGVETHATVSALGPRTSGVDKPVVFYGTSITHGGCASRPGMAFVNIVGRDLDVPVVNLGFSGSGVMEFEMSEHLARIDASCYVLDCLHNMRLEESQCPGRAVKTNYEPFIRNLRAKRPDVPIVMAEQCDVFCGGPNAKDKFIRALYEKLVAEGWKNLVYLPKDGMYAGDLEGTVDGLHPNDLGMASMAKAFGSAVKKALTGASATFTVKGTWVVENGIRKFQVGRAPDDAQAEAAAAYARELKDCVIKIEPSVSLDEVNAMEVPPGAQVLFRRGGVWRGQLQPRSGRPGHPVTYGAFGEGAKPVIQPCYDKSRGIDWTEVSDGLWHVETGAAADIGNIILDHGAKGVCFKRGTLEELVHDLDFWCDPKTFEVYLKSSGNPASRFASIELAVRVHCIDEGQMHDIVYDGLALRYTAAHGIAGSNVKRIAVRNCDISWIGGGYLYYDYAGRGVRYGNGIEFWANCEDVLVVSNRLWECYDAGLTNQSNEDGAAQRNVVYRGNEVWNCEYSYEYWQQGAGARTERVTLEDNVFRDAGRGWGHRQRWNPNAAHLMFYDTTAETKDFIVRGNKFLRSENVLFRLFNDWRASLTFAGNEWVSDGEPLCRYHGRPTKDLIYKYPDRLDCMHDDNLSEIESQGSGARVFAADERDAFRRFLQGSPEQARAADRDASRRQARVVFVDDLDLSCSYNGGGTATGARRSAIGEKPLSLGDKTYTRGIGTRAEGAVGIRLDGSARCFDAEVGVDAFASAARHGDSRIAMVFRVWTDGRIAWQSEPVGEKSAPVAVHVDLSGVHELVLETSSDAPWVAFDACYGVWANARIAGEGSVAAISDPAAIRQLGVLTPSAGPKPHFNGADIWGVRPGRPVVFRVPVSGERPMRFAAKGLPEGVTFDAAKGVLGGVAPSVKGDYDIEVTAENAKGKAVRTIRLAVGDAICLTPPMGWNSWNIWGSRFTGEHARTAARALDESGLGDYGWAYVNLDDFWEMNNSPQNADRPELRGPARDADGNVLPNPSFPDMKGLTDYIHSLGFRAGLYSSPGPVTCGGCEGSYGHEMQDARRWAEWGFDYVKYDWCSYDAVIADVRGGKAWYDDDAWRDVRDEVKERPYRRMRDCLLAQDRDIVYSFCQYGMGKAWEWARDAGANCWRSWEDMKDSWPWMMKALQSRFLGAENYWKYAGPGCWIDPDMLIVGDQTSCGWTHPTFLTPNEQYTHVSLWAMLGAPLLIGCDLAKLDAFTRNLLMNDEVIAVSQDRLGKVARCVRRSDAESVWARPLADGNAAVALVNHYPFAREVRVEFSELGLGGEMWVKDLWRHTCEGRHYGAYAAVVPPHATTLLKVCKVPCPRCD